MSTPLVKVEDLKKYFEVNVGFLKKSQYLKAVDGVSFQIQRGETLGIVGESGSGKSTLGKLITKLIEPTSGRIYFDDVDITSMKEKNFKIYRKNLGLVFQDPSASLHPRMTIREILNRSLIIHVSKDRKQNDSKILDILQKVGLGKEHLDRYPHQLSGGQQQRVAVARAIILNPSLVVHDEPTSSLDVSVQCQILNLLLTIQSEFDLTYLFITHDLVTVRHVSDRIAVMYCGDIVEVAESDELFRRPKHPYTVTLITAASIPNPDIKKIKRFVAGGETPSPINPPLGCKFHPRCPFAEEICKVKVPVLEGVDGNRSVACHRFTELNLSEYTADVSKILESTEMKIRS